MTTSFTASRRELLDVLTAIAPIVPNKPQRDILKCIKIKAQQGNPDTILIYACSNDLESFATYRLDTNVIVQNQGEFVVPAVTFLDYIKSLESDTIEIHQTSEEALKINESGTEMEVGLQDILEFPEFPTIPVDKKDWVALPLSAVKHALSLVIFAVADKGHPKWGALGGTCIHFEKGKVSFIGTDIHRASVAELEIDGQKLDGSYLVSANAMEMASKFLNADFEILPNPPNNLILKNDKCSLFIRLIGGDFPPVKSAITSNKHQQSLDLVVSDFAKQVRKAVLAVDQYNTIRIEIKNDVLHLIAKTKEQRKNIKVTHAINYKGNGIQFAVNCQYLLDLLKASSNDEPLIMRFNRSNQPLLFSQTNFQHLLQTQEVK